MVRQRSAALPPIGRRQWWPPPSEFQNSGDGGIFPKGVARFWDPHAMMVGNVRPEHGTGKRPRYRVWVRCWGLECAWGSEGDASCGGGATLLVRCWGLSSGALREAPYGSVLGHRTACARSLSALCYGDLVSLERLGFLCCIPNVMELVASGVPFLSVLCKGTGRTSKWHTRPRRPLKIILAPRSSCAYSSPRMRNTWAWAFMAFRTSSIALSLVLHDCRARCSPSTPAALGSRGIGIAKNATWLILPVVICLSQRLSHACLVVGPWDGATGPPLGVHLLSRPFYGDALLALIDGSCLGAVTLKKLECSKQAYALDTLAWDNIIGFRSYSVGLRDRTFAKDVFINQERKLGARRRSDTVLVSTISDADQGSADVAYRTPPAPYEKSKSLGSGSMVARLKLKGIDGRAPPGVEPAA
ncbi:hypothetical protein FNV43_RR20618 [Rhamnella rubrinervis]|uniref:Uncharacterized protein n=1 Tax=Rhamnella rubrinervis TaxID=2594499 RepID=A0A8K0GQM7_9ROSA|nr:hypothetical protein FNV43_RR20618 [Rhamnella rubrinervis]